MPIIYSTKNKIMKQKLLLILFLGLNLTAFSEGNDKCCDTPDVSLYISAGYTPSIGYRAVRIGVPQFEGRDAVAKRRNAESSVYNWNVNLQIGLTIKKKYSLYLEGFRMVQGFAVNGTGVDWNTGFNDTSSVQQYNFLSYGIAVGAGYSSYAKCKTVSFLMEAGLYQLVNIVYQEHKTNGAVNEISDPQSLRKAGVRAKGIFGYRIGAGIGIRPFLKKDCGHEIKVMPCLYNTISKIHRNTILTTSLYSVGVTIGYSFRF